MLTNKIGIKYNIENIDRDFDIFRVFKANKDYYKFNILDSALYDFKALAVQWSFGGLALVLFRKGEISEREFRKCITNEYEDVKIEKIDLFNEDQCKENFFYQNRLLGQLLLNSIKTPKHEEFQYSNLTGKLLYHDPSWKVKDKETGVTNFIRFIEVFINPNMNLSLELKTYRRYNGKGGSQYIIDSKTGEFRKKLKTDMNVDTYIEGSLPHSHFRVDEYNINSYASFKKSKLGILEKFLRDVKSSLSEYLSIELTERPNMKILDIPSLERKGITDQKYGEMIEKKGVVIVDENHTTASVAAMEIIKKDLLVNYGIDAQIGSLSKEKYNIRIIHEENFYDENELEDPYMTNLSGYVVQHITEEADCFENPQKKSPAIKKIIQELIIKGDVKDRRISIYDWKKIDSEKSWSFVVRKRCRMEKGETTEHINFNGGKVKKYYKYYRLTIDKKGQLKFDTFCDLQETVDNEWGGICSEYDRIHYKHSRIKENVEGLIYSNIKNINSIILTKEQTLPDVEALVETLKATNPKDQIDIVTLLNAMRGFKHENPDYSHAVENWIEKLNLEHGNVTKGNMKKVLNMRSSAGKLFNRYLHEKEDIWIYGELRNKDFDEEFQISNLLDIQYEYNENDYEDGKSFVYCVGAKSKREKYPCACHIRKVVSNDCEIEYEKLLPLLSVDFVRNGQYTVLPFPFKYLREYINQE